MWRDEVMSQNPAVYMHLKDTGHPFKTEDAVIQLDREERYRERGIKEAM